MEESIEGRTVPISIKTAAGIVLFLIAVAGAGAMWGQMMTSKMDQNCHDISAIQGDVKELRSDKVLVERSVAVVINEMGYIKSSLSRIEHAITKGQLRDRAEYREQNPQDKVNFSEN